MQIYVEPVECDVCGGEGLARPGATGHRWMGGELRHSDPKVCAMFLKRKARELERREAELKTQTH